jgi:hypothetical protein
MLDIATMQKAGSLLKVFCQNGFEAEGVVLV